MAEKSESKPDPVVELLEKHDVEIWKLTALQGYGMKHPVVNGTRSDTAARIREVIAAENKGVNRG